MKKKEKVKVNLPIPIFPMQRKELEPFLGAFVIEFENLMEVLRGTINTVLHKVGLKDTIYSEILMYDSTGKNLADYYHATLKQYFPKTFIPPPPEKAPSIPPDEELIHKFIEVVFDKVGEACTLRNVILHSYWQIMYLINDEPTFIGDRFGVNKTYGLNPKYPDTISKAQFQKFIDNIRILHTELDSFLIVFYKSNKDEMLWGVKPFFAVKHIDFTN